MIDPLGPGVRGPTTSPRASEQPAVTADVLDGFTLDLHDVVNVDLVGTMMDPVQTETQQERV